MPERLTPARILMIGALLLVSVVVVAPSEAEAMRTGPAGLEYSSSFGAMTFLTNETATYNPSQSGMVAGTLVGHVLTGTWAETLSNVDCGTPGPAPGANHWGTITFTFAEDWSSFDGAWGYCNDPQTDNWDGTVTTNRCRGLFVTIDMTEGDSGIGTPGADIILGTLGPDVISGGGGDDTICGQAGDDIIRGGAGDDVIQGDDGDDEIFGGGGADMIFGGSGDDTINGQGGTDTIEGGLDDDTINGGGAADTVLGDDGNDVLSGQNGADFLDGGSGADSIKGQTGPDVLRGLSDDDELFGGNGNDMLTGHAGFDLCAGNKGPADSASSSTCELTPGVEVFF